MAHRFGVLSVSGDYATYLKAFGEDLKRVAVWLPGETIELGDFGKFEGDTWLKLGNIFKLISQLKSFSEPTESKPLQVQMGSAQIVGAGAHAGYSANTVADATFSIKFKKKNSLFFSATGYVTRSLNNVQAIVDVLANDSRWRKDEWSFVNLLDVADKFQVVIGKEAGGEAKVEASTGELAKSFINGDASAGAGIQISGNSVTSFIGQTGAVSMGLIKVRKSLLGNAIAKQDMKFYSSSDSEDAVERISAEEFLRLCGIGDES